MNILITAFKNTSSEHLIDKINLDCAKIIISNDKIISTEQISNAIKNIEYDYIFSFGQRPNIKDKLHIERYGRLDNATYETNFKLDMLKRDFEKWGLIVKISENAGTSFCNLIYAHTLDFIQSNNYHSKAVFIHIPFEKNILDFDNFALNVSESIKQYCQI